MKASDLINTVNMILMQQERKQRKEKKKPKLRSEKEQNYISNAKMMLMQRNHLSEDDAIPVYPEIKYGFRNQYGRNSTDASDAVIRKLNKKD